MLVSTEEHKVKVGDTLSQIVVRAGSTVQELLKLNPDKIYIGQKLKLPAGFAAQYAQKVKR